MQSVASAPAHELLQRTDNADSHSTRKTSRGASSAFASYVFGPLDLKDGQAADLKKDSAKPITGAVHNPLHAHSLLFANAATSPISTDNASAAATSSGTGTTSSVAAAAKVAA